MSEAIRKNLDWNFMICFLLAEKGSNDWRSQTNNLHHLVEQSEFHQSVFRIKWNSLNILSYTQECSTFNWLLKFGHPISIPMCCSPFLQRDIFFSLINLIFFVSFWWPSTEYSSPTWNQTAGRLGEYITKSTE